MFGVALPNLLCTIITRIKKGVSLRRRREDKQTEMLCDGQAKCENVLAILG